MTAHFRGQFRTDDRHPFHADASLMLGLVVGLAMPLAAAWIYPTYVHLMPNPVVEWTRLQEVPFVIAEAIVAGFAMVRGMELRHLKERIPRDCLIAGALLLIGLWASTVLVSKVPETSLMISLSTVVHLLFGFSVLHLLEQDNTASTERFVVGLGLGLAALATLTAWRLLLPPPASQVPGGIIEWGSALPGFINVRHFGSWTGALAAIFAAFILHRRGGDALSRYDLFFLFAMTMTIWSGTRAALVAIAASIAIIAFSQRRLFDLGALGRLAILTGTASCFAYFLEFDDPAFALIRTIGDAESVDQMSSGRISMWAATIARWQEAPWFGWGSGSTFWEVNTGWTHTQPHNFVLQFLISWGLIGAAGALWLLGRATVAAHRRALANPGAWPLNAGLYTLLIMALLEGMLHYPRFIMLAMTLYALIFRIGETRHKADAS